MGVRLLLNMGSQQQLRQQQQQQQNRTTINDSDDDNSDNESDGLREPGAGSREPEIPQNFPRALTELFQSSHRALPELSESQKPGS